jgi:hypothetical protein
VSGVTGVCGVAGSPPPRLPWLRAVMPPVPWGDGGPPSCANRTELLAGRSFKRRSGLGLGDALRNAPRDAPRLVVVVAAVVPGRLVAW